MTHVAVVLPKRPRETFFEFTLKLNCLQNSLIFRAVFRLNGLRMKSCCIERTPAKVICRYIYSRRANRFIRTTESYQQTKTRRLPLKKATSKWTPSLKILSSLFGCKSHSLYSYIMIAIHKTKNCSRKSKICKQNNATKERSGERFRSR